MIRDTSTHKRDCPEEYCDLSCASGPTLIRTYGGVAGIAATRGHSKTVTHELFNFVEGIFWLLIAAGLLVNSFRKKRLRKVFLVAALLFALFGFSDFVETRTGAWWKPWWLLAWKAGCLTGLAIDYIIYRRYRSRAAYK